MSTLSSLLRQLDASQAAIQRAASCMIKMYDSSSWGAVTEWRNCLQIASTDQLLAFLYVCNEVLQTSKRNRGNKFLEAFSPVLSQSLQHMAIRLNDPTQTEKIRRVVKIWGDRQIFSVRFVNELLAGLERYRHKNTTNVVQHQRHEEQQQQLPLSATVLAAPATTESKPQKVSNESGPDASKGSESKTSGDDDDADDDEEEDFMDTLEDKNRLGIEFGDSNEVDENDENDDLDDDVFGDSSQRSDQLKLEINVSESLAGTHDSVKLGAKRRRASIESTTSNTSKKSKKVVKKSMSQFIDILNRLKQLKQKFDLAQLNIQRIHHKLQDDRDGSELENLVGNELLTAKKQNDADIQTIIEQRKILYETAVEQHALEEQIKNQYFPWFQAALQQDSSDLLFCSTLERTIRQFLPIHIQIVEAYKAMKMDEDEKQRRALERERIRREEEEAERFRKAALAKETEAKPGMVWNPSTREYQSLNTDESWRD